MPDSPRPRDVMHQVIDGVTGRDFAPLAGLYAGEATTTGRPFISHNIVVMRVREGLIVESRDYHDHYAIGEALRT